MNKVLIADDARIVRFLRLEKLYPDDDPVDPRPRGGVSLWRAEELDAPSTLRCRWAAAVGCMMT